MKVISITMGDGFVCVCVRVSCLSSDRETRAGNIWALSTSLSETWLRCTDRCSQRRLSHVQFVASQKDWAFSRALRIW